MKKIGALILAIGLLIAFILPYLRKDDSGSAQAQVEFGFESNRTYMSVRQGQIFPFNCLGIKNIDRIEVSIDGKVNQSWKISDHEPVGFEMTTEGLKIGTYSIELKGYHQNAVVGTDSRFLFVNASKETTQLTYEILATYPHNPNNFTQGYEFFNDRLYESTGNPGQNNATKVAQIDPETGKSIQEFSLPNPIFGEGITVLGSKIYQISWQEQKCFIYDGLNEFNLIDTLTYSGEGWGLCNDGQYIIMSDGSHVLTYRDPETFEVVKTVNVHSDRGPVTNLNELEFFNGRIYANVWMSEQHFQHDSRMNLTKIVVINPKNGVAEHYLDVLDLFQKVAAKNVPNGIAYRKKTNSFWITGKYWDSAFEIKILPKNIADAH